MIVRSSAIAIVLSFTATTNHAWVMTMNRPHRTMQTTSLAAFNDPDYLMPADVFKKKTWEPSTAQPVISPQPQQQSFVPPPPEDTTTGSNDQEDMFLISASTSVSRPPAPTTHPSALRPIEAVTTARPAVLATPVDDRNILFWRDRMTAQEEERNQKGFRPAFVAAQEQQEAASAVLTNEVTSAVSSEAAEPTEPTSTVEDLPQAVSTTSTSSTLPDPLLTPPAPVSTAPTTKQPVVGDIQVTFWRDRMNEQEEERVERGFRKPFVETVEAQNEVAVGVAAVEPIASTLDESKVNEEPELSVEPAVSEVEEEYINGAAMEVSEPVGLSEEAPELSTEPVDMTYTLQTEAEAIARSIEEDLTPESVLNELGPEEEPELITEPVAITSVPETNEEVEIAAAPVLETKAAEDIGIALEDESEPVVMESGNEVQVAEDMSETLTENPAPTLETTDAEDVLASEPVVTDADNQIDAFENELELESKAVEDPIYEPQSAETHNTNGVNGVNGATGSTTEIVGAEEKVSISEPIALEVNGHVNGHHSVESANLDAAVTGDSPSPPVVTATAPEDAAAKKTVAPISAHSSTKELLQYLFTGSPEGSDQLTDETVNQYLADPMAVIAKLDPSLPVIEQATNGEASVGDMAGSVNGKSNVATPSTSELLDILFGVNEEKPAGQGNESRRNGSSEELNGSSPIQESAAPVHEPTKEEEEAEKERLTSEKIREMALFTLKELLSQDRQ